MKNHFETAYMVSGPINQRLCIRTGGINRLGRLPTVSGQVCVDRIVGGRETNRVLDSGIEDGDFVVCRLCGGFTRHGEAAPRLVAFVNDLCRVFFVLGLSGEGECVLGLAIG